jgi:cGMP-dependent protein kinase
VLQEGINLADVKHLAILGAGGFGKVSLVEYRGKHYALKQMAKAHIVDHHLVTHVHREKKAMMECESPWLVNLVGTAKDANNIYMMIEAVLGGELFAYLQVGRAARGCLVEEGSGRGGIFAGVGMGW